jgi:hypothetical protein
LTFSYKDWIGAARDTSLFLGVWLFIIGAYYQDAYFRGLKIPATSGVTDVNTIMTYASSVVAANWPFLLVLTLPFAGLAWGAQCLMALGMYGLAGRRIAWNAIVIALMVTFTVKGQALGTSAGKLLAAQKWSNPPYSRLYWSATAPADVQKALAPYNCLRDPLVKSCMHPLILLGETSDSYFVGVRAEIIGPFRIAKTSVVAVSL